MSYSSDDMTLFGLVVLLFLLGVAKAANHFQVGPRWLRRFKLEKRTLY